MSWNDFMKRLVIGKQTNKDFGKDGLPHNRRQVFGFVYKQKALTVFYNNLLVMLFSLPLIAISVFYFLYGMRHGKFTSTEEANSILMGKYLLLIPSLMIGSIGLAGAVYVTRKMCWDDSVSFWSDFKRGIRNSISQYLVISLITGIIMYLIEALYNEFLYGKQSFLSVTVMASLGVVFVLFLITTVYAFALSAQYKMGIFSLYKSASILMVKRLFNNVLMVILGFLPISVCFFIPYAIPYFIGVTILAFGGVSYCLLICFLFTASAFDKYINEKYYPDYVGKGIYTTPETAPEQTHSDDEIDELAKSIAESDVEDSQ